jgi:hypothetical protein
MPLDMERLSHLSALVHLHEKTLGHPKLKAISDEAMKELEAAAKSLEPEKDPAEVVLAGDEDQGQDIDQEEADRVRAEAKAQREVKYSDFQESTSRSSRR